MSHFVRPATPGDLESLVAFTRSEAAEAEGVRPDSGRLTEGIRAGLADPGKARYWVLVEDESGELVGNVSIVREWSDWHAGYYWWSQSLFLVPECRGQGLMGPLLEAVRSAARAENALELRLYVHAGNQRAMRAYRKAGFAPSEYQLMTMAV